jgi:hypothetical protein
VVTSAPRPVAADRLADEVAHVVDRAAASCSHILRVAVDGHAAAAPADFADALVGPLRLLGRPVLRVGAEWFLRPASLRLERGRTDPDAFYDDRLDVAALRREVLDPLGPDGSGRYLPTLWDPATDRATRAQYAEAPRWAVLIVDGTLLLGHGLPFDLTVHLRLSAGARERRADESERWALPAYARYEQEVDPERAADVLIRLDDPRHPALSFPTG